MIFFLLNFYCENGKGLLLLGRYFYFINDAYNLFFMVKYYYVNKSSFNIGYV